MYMQTLLAEIKEKKAEIAQMTEEFDSYQDLIEASKSARIEVSGDVYSGTKICISDVSMVVKNTMSYCRFTKTGGEVKMSSL